MARIYTLLRYHKFIVTLDFVVGRKSSKVTLISVKRTHLNQDKDKYPIVLMRYDLSLLEEISIKRHRWDIKIRRVYYVSINAVFIGPE